MSDVQVRTVASNAELSAFIGLPWQVYAEPREGEPCHWVPPLKSQEKELVWPPLRHPFWENARCRLFLARRGNTVVGRIAAVVDDNYNSFASTACGTWGFFECMEDYDAAAALFTAAADWLRSEGMTFMRGPFNPSANHSCGVLTHGFHLPPAVMMPWNFPYYAKFMELWGMRKEQDLLAYTIRSKGFQLPPWLKRQLDTLKERREFTYRTSSRATLSQDISLMLDVYRESWAQNWGFCPMSENEARQTVKELKSVLDPEFFVLFYHKETIAGGMLALADMNLLLKRLNGRLSPLLPWHYWKVRKEMKRRYRVALFGLKEEFRMAGLPFLLVDFMLEQMRKNPDFEWIEGSWVLEDNAPICDLMEDFSGTLDKRYRIYRKELL